MSGQQVDSGQGSISSQATTVRLQSRRTGGGTATASLSGQSANASVGVLLGGPGQSLLGQSATTAQGAVTKQVARLLTGNASNSVQGSVAIPGVGALSTTFTLSPATTDAAAPFAFGHAFRQGDVPSGQTVFASGTTEFQCSPLTFWPDGSLKHAVIAGRASVTSGVAKALTLTAATNQGGVAIAEADLIAAAPDVTVTLSGLTPVTLASVLGTAHRTVCAGPVMSNWIYRAPIPGNSHLVVWFDVRLYVGGRIEVFPWVENGFLLLAGTVNFLGTATVAVGGVQVFSQAVDIKHHTRIPLVVGSTFSYWIGGDPLITPKHDTVYLQATRLVPKLAGPPSESTLAGLQQTYTTNTLAGVPSTMTNAGGSGSLIHAAQALYINSGADPRAYRSAIVFGLSGGSWSIHYRDDATNEPFKFTDRPTISTNAGGSPVVAGGTGGTNGVAGAAGTYATHEPSFGYLPFLITARWWFLDESMFWMCLNYAQATPAQRFNADGIIDTFNGTYALRGAAWALRSLAQSLALCPTSHPLFAGMKAAWENNCLYYSTKYVVGGAYKTDNFGTAHISPQGFLGDYSSDFGGPAGERIGNFGTFGNQWWGAGYMQNYGVEVWGFTSNLGLPVSATAKAQHEAVRNHAYKQVVARSGDGLNGNYSWRNFVVFDYCLGADALNYPPETWYTGAQSYAALMGKWTLDAALPPTPGLTLRAHDNGGDITPGSSAANDYGPSAVAGLAFAVEHGAPGAAEGWLRITGASNFSAIENHRKESPAHGARPPVEPTTDQLQAALNTLAADTWSANLATNTYVGSVIERRKADPTFGTYYAVPGTPAVAVVAENPWSFSSGCYVQGRKKYIFTGGGHDDWLGSEVGTFDCATLTWARTDESAKLQQDVNDPTAPMNPNDVTAGAVGRWKAWRNPSGRYAPLSCHMYGGMVYLPSIDRVHVMGAASYRSGNGGAGGAVYINAATGQYDDAFAHAGAAGGSTDNVALRIPTVVVLNASNVQVGTKTDCIVRITYSAGNPSAALVDPVTKTSATQVGFFSAAGNRLCHGCVVPDPGNPGRLAYVSDRDATTLAVFPRVDMVRDTGGAHSSVVSRAYGNAKPAALGTGSDTRWIYMGDFIPGCTKIAVFKPGVGLFALNTTDWTWSALIVASPVAASTDSVHKRFEYLSDYDAFCMWGNQGQAFHVLKRPVIFS